jgi:hypothetical protein
VAAVEDLPQPLNDVAGNLEDTGWAAEVCDADWRLVYVTSQLRDILGSKDDAEHAIGRHILEVRGTPFWQSIIEPDRSGQWVAENVPHMLADDPGVRDRLLAMVKPELQPIVEAAEPAPVGTWTSVIRLRSVGASLGLIRYFGVRARLPDGTPAATLYIYGSNLPAGLLAMVTRGRLTHFERMARLVEPGRREAAILFADVEASGKLSRRLPSSTYFDFIRDFSTASDETKPSSTAAASSATTPATASPRSSSSTTSARPRARRGPRSRSGAACRTASSARAPRWASLRARCGCASGCTGAARSTWDRWSRAGASRSPPSATRSTSARGWSRRRPVGRCSRPRR